MLNYYKTYHEIPIFNFFESQEDISFMLKDFKKINDGQKLFLEGVRSEMQEWFSQEVAQEDYNHFINSMNYINKLRYKHLAISTLHDSLKGFDLYCRVEDVLNEENLNSLKEACRALSIPFRKDLKDMQRTLGNFSAAVYGRIEYKMNEIKKSNSGGKFDYMNSVIYLSKDLGFKINPKDTTLYEYAKLIKKVK
jgi:hypothetical protein